MSSGTQIARRIRRVARETFDFTALRPGQEDAIRAVLDGRDTLAVMPTGSGKSAIYQIAAEMLDGPTVVISPLIALQRDQLEQIEEQGLGQAVAVNSHLGAGERREAFEALDEGDLEFLFLAPEQFASQETIARVREAKPALFVVDEAHCISEWGHDFRPEYLRLGAVLDAIGRPPVLALTATAAPPVRAEIVERLGMRKPALVVQGFDRPNITLMVETYTEEHLKRAALVDAVIAAERPGIVYVATRKHAEEIAAALEERGIPSAHYHAGMKPVEREEMQERFMGDQLQVIVATIAFGMGIDKPNVRFVFHYEISDSVDSYYQEIGRAGRDGEPARAVLFYRQEDLAIHRFLSGGGQVDLEEVETVARTVAAHHEPVEPRQLREETHLSQTKLMTALIRLEEAGVVHLLPTGEVAPGEVPENLEDVVETAVSREEHHRQYERSRLEMMRGYAELYDCRRKFLLNYFGEEFHAPCGNCDNCLAGHVRPDDDADRPFPLNSRVVHQRFGAGMVQRYEGDSMTVLFDEVGYKTLSVEAVTTGGLLQAAS